MPYSSAGSSHRETQGTIGVGRHLGTVKGGADGNETQIPKLAWKVISQLSKILRHLLKSVSFKVV
jgi:hypothetical protein